jgi:HD-like signal output (HDOD) protein
VRWKGLREQAAVATGNFSKLFGKMEIPPLPKVAARLVQMCGDDEVDLGEIAKLVSSDAGISTKILHTVNSAYLGFHTRIPDVREAVVRLGLSRTQSLAVGYSAAAVLPKPEGNFDQEAFWQRSLQRAVFAETLASKIARGAQGEAFTGALLQDMAFPILLAQWGKYYQPVLDLAAASERDLIQVEEEQLSWNHTQAGAWMAGNWGLPDVLVCCIGLHHTKPQDLEALNLADSPVVAVAVSSRLPDTQSICCGSLGISEEKYLTLCETTDQVCAQLADLFGVSRPKPLLDPDAPSVHPDS